MAIYTKTNLDSTAIDLSYIGWEAGETTLDFEPGNNSNKFITLQRADPEDVYPVYGKQYIEGYLGILKDGSPGSVNVPAEDAIVVIQYEDDNPDPDIPALDTIPVQSTGYWVSDYAYPDGAQLFIGAGYPGGVHNGQELGSYKYDYVAEGRTLLDIAAGDTSKIYKMSLVQKSVWQGQTEENVDMSMAQLKEMYGQPHYHIAKFGIYAYHIDETGFNDIGIGTIQGIITNYNNWLPFTFVQSDNTLNTNTDEYNPETANALDYGTNIIEGIDQQISVQATPLPTIQGESAGYISNLIGLTGSPEGAAKEIMHRAFGMGPVTSRPNSVGNANASLPNTLDIGIMIQKYFLDKAMINSEETIDVPFDYQNQTQNVSPSYLSDDTSITPQ